MRDFIAAKLSWLWQKLLIFLIRFLGFISPPMRWAWDNLLCPISNLVSPPLSWAWRRLFRAHAVIPLVTFVLFVVVAGFAANDFSRYPWLPPGTSPRDIFSDPRIPFTCKEVNPDSAWMPTGAFVAVLGAFFLGGLLGKLKHRMVPPGKAVAGLAVQVNLTLLSLVIGFAWWYETTAVASMRQLEPITQYVMCIRGHQNDWALLMFIVGALVAGRWLWHRPGNYLQ